VPAVGMEPPASPTRPARAVLTPPGVAQRAAPRRGVPTRRPLTLVENDANCAVWAEWRSVLRSTSRTVSYPRHRDRRRAGLQRAVHCGRNGTRVSSTHAGRRERPPSEAATAAVGSSTRVRTHPVRGATTGRGPPPAAGSSRRR
jgi:hypothetical protein